MSITFHGHPLLVGMVVETRTRSYTGEYLLYSDYGSIEVYTQARGRHFETQDPLLNQIARWGSPLFLNVLVGITRIVVAVFHIIGHLFAALITQDKGHLYHAAKGGCEALRGLIEMIPIIGNLFSAFYSVSCLSYGNSRSWWMIKIYNPDRPDVIDRVGELGFDDRESGPPYWLKRKNGAAQTHRDYYVCLEPQAAKA